MSALEKFFCSLTFSISEIPIGIIIRVVAVLEIHMDKNPVASMNPRIILDGLVPILTTMFNAIRLCNSHFSIARAIIKPPRNRKIRGCAYGKVVDLRSSPPKTGNKTIGSRAVVCMGIASVNHHMAIHVVLAIMAFPPSESPSIEIKK